jgi:hypothetical protein
LLTIDYLTKQLHNISNPTVVKDLLDFD